MDTKICEIHNEPALFCEQDAQQNLSLMCKYCVQQKLTVQNIDEKKDQIVLEQLQLKFDEGIKLLIDFVSALDQFTYQIQTNLQKFKEQMEQNISQMIEKKNLLKNKNNYFTTQQVNQLNEKQNIVDNQLKEIAQAIKNQLKELQIITQLDQLYQSLNNLLIDENKNKVNDQTQNQLMIIKEKKFDYELIQQGSYKQSEQCNAITFNKDATIMIAGCDKLIKIFEFKDDKLKLVQQLNLHTNNVVCLQFMQKSNQFISASFDLIIWEQNQNNLWHCKKILKDNEAYIRSIAINQNEDMLIFGSDNQTIQFWKFQNNKWECNQSISCSSEVYSISLNNQEDNLIASVYNKLIFVIQLEAKEWIIKQKISVQQLGLRLCFINQTQFVFQPCDRKQLLIFDYDLKDQCFKQGMELQYQNKALDGNFSFPIQYIAQFGLLIVKNDHHVHVIKKSQNGQFAVEQSINFDTNQLFGSVTDDGKYLATWDKKSKEIKIRKLNY